jgi:hypothetical protein
MVSLNELVFCVAPLTCLREGKAVCTATGFFYGKDDERFLITNRHVVRDENKGHFPDSLRLYLHTFLNPTVSDFYEVLLYDQTSETPRWRELAPDVDVVALPLNAQEIRGKFYTRTLFADELLPGEYLLGPGEDVFVMGYPLGFFDEGANLPIFRNAMIASMYGVDFNGMPCFLTDANLHPGTSGSPVFTKPKPVWQDMLGNLHTSEGNKYYLLGVNSGTYTSVGLGCTWYAHLIEGIVSLPRP